MSAMTLATRELLERAGSAEHRRRIMAERLFRELRGAANAQYADIPSILRRQSR